MDHKLVWFNTRGNPLKYTTVMAHLWKLEEQINQDIESEDDYLPVEPHNFRRYCLQRLFDATQDLRLVAQVAGHAQIQTTELYLGVHESPIDTSRLEKVKFT